ncbi:MAG TPA: pentapeptide repeat-containing protein [Streptosporangiaceae bacterium]|nr:pentapeptide repeat-containing protein [Streptosporangiaceae bacterium]
MPRDHLADLPYASTLRPHQGELAPDEDYEGVHFDGLDLDAPRAPGSRFMECAFTQVTMQDGRLRRARFNDVWLRGVRLTATELSDSNWIDATIIGSMAAGVVAHGSRLRQVTFRGCKLQGVNFRAATLTGVIFEDCMLREVDFGGATLRRCQFPGSQLHETDFSQVTLDKVDLRGAELGIIITPGALSGATITPVQLAELAPLLAEHAGITVA